MGQKTLYKDPTNKMIGGVCAGLAEYFGVDVSLVRIIFAALALMAVGSPVVVYVILWIVLPDKPVA